MVRYIQAMRDNLMGIRDKNINPASNRVSNLKMHDLLKKSDPDSRDVSQGIAEAHRKQALMEQRFGHITLEQFLSKDFFKNNSYDAFDFLTLKFASHLNRLNTNIDDKLDPDLGLEESTSRQVDLGKASEDFAKNAAYQAVTDDKFMLYLRKAFLNLGMVMTVSPDMSKPVTAAPQPHLQIPEALEGLVSQTDYQAWRHVQATLARLRRASLTPEQAAIESQAGTERAKKSRAHLSPEKRTERNAKAADWMRKKRTPRKDPQP